MPNKKIIPRVKEKPRSPDWGTPESTKKAKEMTPNESVEGLNERSPSEMAKFAIGKLVFKKEYTDALDSLMSLLKRRQKKRASSGTPPRHSTGYYAAQIAKSYPHVDGKTLNTLIPKTFVFEEAPAGSSGPATNTGSIPDSTDIGPMNGSRKKAIVTKRYIEILGKRRKREV